MPCDKKPRTGGLVKGAETALEAARSMVKVWGEGHPAAILPIYDKETQNVTLAGDFSSPHVADALAYLLRAGAEMPDKRKGSILRDSRDAHEQRPPAGAWETLPGGLQYSQIDRGGLDLRRGDAVLQGVSFADLKALAGRYCRLSPVSQHEFNEAGKEDDDLLRGIVRIALSGARNKDRVTFRATCSLIQGTTSTYREQDHENPNMAVGAAVMKAFQAMARPLYNQPSPRIGLELINSEGWIRTGDAAVRDDHVELI